MIKEEVLRELGITKNEIKELSQEMENLKEETM